MNIKRFFSNICILLMDKCEIGKMYSIIERNNTWNLVIRITEWIIDFQKTYSNVTGNHLEHKIHRYPSKIYLIHWDGKFLKKGMQILVTSDNCRVTLSSLALTTDFHSIKAVKWCMEDILSNKFLNFMSTCISIEFLNYYYVFWQICTSNCNNL